MTIGIMTFWDSYDNYGQLLQCWALQKYLKSLGHTPYLVRYNRTKPSYTSIVHLMRNEIKELVKKYYSRYWKREFNEFRKNNISVSDIVYKDLKALKTTPPFADIYITGSDQVWNYEMSEMDRQAFHLQFGPDSVKRISYAPSIGHPTYEKKLYQELYIFLRDFSSISVREQTAVEIIKEAGFIATQVLDPTLLLTEREYAELLSKNEVHNDPYVFIYSMNYVSLEDLPYNEIEEYAKNKKYKIVVTPGTGLHRCRKLFKNVDYDYANPYQWLANIRNSELVVTASFHGVVFCILFHKKFIYTPLMGLWEGKLVQKRGNGRVLDLLNRLGLNECVYDKSRMVIDYINHEVDWKIVEEKLSCLRESSIKFLLSALC